jgi:hypothetical protein
MKLYIFPLTIVLVFLQGMLIGQDLARTVISSTGEYRRSDAFHLSYTIGEPAVFTRSVAGFYWKAGFQQGIEKTGVGLPDKHLKSLSFDLYPNPGSGAELFLRLNGTEHLPGESEIQLFALGSGIPVKTSIQKPLSEDEPMSIQIRPDLPSGVYLVVIRSSKGILASRPWMKL